MMKLSGLKIGESALILDFKGLTEKGTEVRAQGLSKMRV